jgi:hypothetical protein
VLFEIHRHVRTHLAARGCPLRVVYGPERLADSGLTDSRIVIERERGSGDSIRPPKSTTKNPHRRAERGLAGVVRIFAKSSTPGARIEDHETVCEQAVDMIIIALQHAAAKEDTRIAVESSGYLSADDSNVPSVETWPGVVYEISIELARGVFDRTWAGNANAEQSEFTVSTAGCVAVAEEEDD